VPRDKMLNVLDILKWKRYLQYAAGVTGQFKAEMGQQRLHIVLYINNKQIHFNVYDVVYSLNSH
jgi:hypothetical protein